jgi:glycosyltransferase involved in cell wall biosynthesis/CelD/BcsL family acetyltransferase involved in cellulose biosynthesis
MRAVVVEDLDLLSDHLADWDALAVARGRPFCAPGWMLSWWRHARSGDARLRVVLVFDRAQLAGVGPFFAQVGALGIVELRLLGAGFCHRIEPLATPGREAAVAAALSTQLAAVRPVATSVVFEGMDADEPWTRLIASTWPSERPPRLRNDFTMEAPIISLGRSFESWFERRPRHFRKEARRTERRLQEARVRTRTATDAQAVDALLRLHHARWQARGGSNVGDRAAQVIAGAASQLGDAGRLGVVLLEAPDGPVAAELVLRAGKNQVFWGGGFDPAWSRFSPGTQAILVGLRDAASAGISVVDLGGGAHEYKYRLADASAPLVWRTLFPRGKRYPLARAQLAPKHVTQALRGAARRLPPRPRALLKRLARSGRRGGTEATTRRRVLMVEEGGVGGVAHYTGELTAALARQGWQVRLGTARDNGYPPAPGVHVQRLFLYVRGRRPLGRVLRRMGVSRAANGLAHLVADLSLGVIARGSDIVHVQGEEWPPLGAARMVVLRAAGRHVVYTPHNTFDRGARSYARAHAVIRRCAAAILVHSEYDRRMLAPAQAAKAIVIPHGEYGGLARRSWPDLEPAAARAALGLTDDALVVLLFGQLRPDKGVRDLLEAARHVPEATVLLAGEDNGALDEAADLLEAESLRGRVVIRRGFVASAEIGRVFAAADVVALPYHRASASGVLLLAYGYARPVVAYPVGGIPEYVSHGTTGWLCTRADPEALAEQLHKIAAVGRQECLAKGVAAQRFASERLAWEPIARRTAELYEALVRGQRLPATQAP